MALTIKQEKFAQAVALQGMTQSAAYSACYDAAKLSPANLARRASEVARHPEVAARMVVLTERAAADAVKKAAYTLDAAITEADQLIADARSLGQVSAAVAAAKHKAQLAGHLVEKKEITNRSGLDDLDAEKLKKLRDELNARLDRAREAQALVGGTEMVQPQLRRVVGAR